MIRLITPDGACRSFRKLRSGPFKGSDAMSSKTSLLLSAKGFPWA
jgi:hypothetical protein